VYKGGKFMLGDLYKNYKEYRYDLTLCKPNGSPLVSLPESSPTVEYIQYFDSNSQTDELTFDIPATIEDSVTHKTIHNPNYDLINGDYLIKLDTVYVGNIEDKIMKSQMFIITLPEEDINDVDKKTAHCYSREIQLSRKGNVYFSGTRMLYVPRFYYSFDNINWTKYTNSINANNHNHIYVKTKDYDNSTDIFADEEVLIGTNIINGICFTTDIATRYNMSFTEITLERVGLTSDGILNLMEDDYTVGWKVGTIAKNVYYDSVNNRNLFRTFNISGKTWRDILSNDITSAFTNAYYEYDTINKVINICDLNDDKYNLNKGLYISEMNYLQKFNLQPQHNTIYTMLHVSGNNCSINDVNPNGTDTIENYDYYQKMGYMSDDLSNALDGYNALLNSKKGVFNGYLTQLGTFNNTLSEQQNKLSTLNGDMSKLEDDKNTLMQTGGSLTDINNQINAKQVEIANQQILINETNSQIDAINESIAELRSIIDKKNNFTEEQLSELSDYVYELSWQKDTYDSTMTQELYDAAVKALESISVPALTYSIDIANLFDIKDCQYEWDKLTIGSLVAIHYTPLDRDVELRITKIDHKAGDSLQIEIRIRFSRQMI
jgi:hypothetical protein